MKPLHSKDSVKKAFSPRPKSQSWYKNHKSVSSSLLLTPSKYMSDVLSSHVLSLPICSDNNLFQSLHPNGAIHGGVQDTPLALTTKPRSQSSTPNSKPLLAATSPPHHMPINLSTGTKEMLGASASPLKSSALSGLLPISRKTKAVDLARGSESDIHSSKDSDDSLGDDYDDDNIDDEDSGSSLSG